MNFSKKIIGLDLLRFLTALIMVMFHVQGLLKDSFIHFLGFNGFYGTSIFFILSGFILTHVYQNKIIINSFSNSNFLIKRFSALYPIHISTMFVSIIVLFSLLILTGKNLPIEVAFQTLPSREVSGTSVLGIYDIFQYILENIFLMQAWDYRFLLFNGAAWSISSLFFFYLTFHFFVKKIYKIKNLYLIQFTIWLLYLFFPFFFVITQNYSSEINGLIHRNPLLRLPEFITGIIFYNICLRQKKYLTCYQSLFFSLGLTGFIICYFLVKSNAEVWYYLAHNGLFLFFQMALIYSFLNLSIHNPIIKNYIERLGKSSLSIYMIHLPLLSVYFILYRISIAIFQGHSFAEVITIAKNMEHMSMMGLLIFLIILVPLSLFLQEKIFTPIQTKLSNKLTQIKISTSQNKVES